MRDADRIIGLIEAEEKGPGQLIINRVKIEMVKRGDMLSTEDVLDILAIQLIGIDPGRRRHPGRHQPRRAGRDGR